MAKWIIKVQTDDGSTLYAISEHELNQLNPHAQSAYRRDLVTINYATIFPTKRVATELAVERGIRSLKY